MRAQARLQVQKRDTGQNVYELLDAPEGRGFQRLPRPDDGDLFFDIEGDPLYPDGLEYLFGFYYFENGKPVFKPFWAHEHDRERAAFQEVMDFITRELERHPGAHIYHYNHYEETAIKRLASRYGTREAAVDDLLRRGKLVDLFKVVREAIRVSEPRYTLKNLETMYCMLTAQYEPGLQAMRTGLETARATGVHTWTFQLLVHGYGAALGAGDLDTAARIAKELFEYLDGPIMRVAAMDTLVAYAPQLEDAILPQSADVLKAISELHSY